MVVPPAGCEVSLGPSLLEHRDVDAALAGDLDRAVVAGVRVAQDAHRRVGGEDALELLGGQIRPIGDDDHAGVLAVADPDAAAVVDARPTSRRPPY